MPEPGVNMNRLAIVKKRLRKIEKKEKKWVERALKKDKEPWYDKFTSKIPKGVASKLELAFGKGFELLFFKGSKLLAKTYPKETILQDYKIRNYIFEVKGTKKSFRKIVNRARRAQISNTALLAVEGFGMGITGMGIPDIPIFLALLLKGIYEIASCFGCDFESRNEGYFILILMEIAVLNGKEKITANQMVDEYINQIVRGDMKDFDFSGQLKRTADVYATNTLFLKFLQGTPIIGIVGGLYNPVFYKRIAQYARIKYEKRYLLQKTIELKNA